MPRSSKARASMLVLAVVFAAVALFVVLHGAQSNPAGSQELGDPLDGLAANQPSGAMPRALGETPSTKVFTSRNVERIGFLPFTADQPLGRPANELVPNAPAEVLTATGANIRGDYMYLTSWKNISIYDIYTPSRPRPTAIRPVGFQFENENVATNGEILLFSEELPGLPDTKLHVYDVSDKTKIVEIATVEGAGDHTTTCILGCTWAYGSDGSITDLRDPADPVLRDENWHELTGLNEDGAHDVNEFKNGFLVTSPISDDMQYLGVRDPLNPKVLARGKHPNPDAFLFHSGTWPRKGADKFLLMQGEKNFRPRCNRDQGPFMTYVASRARSTAEFRLVDTYRVENGNYVNGSPAINALGCSAHWFEVHPTWKDGGVVAHAYYEHGTHFLNVDKKGRIERKGYFLPAAGSTSAAYWITREIVYAVDYTRGIDILRYTGPGTSGKLTGANDHGIGRG